MKKIYFLFTLLLTVGFSFGQEQLMNQSFETWTSPTSPDSWTVAAGITQESTQTHSGAFSAKHTGGASGSVKLSQRVTGIIPGTSYTVSVWYKVESGDDTDARIWSKWALDGANDNATDADVLQGVGGNGYFDTNGNAWTQYTTTVTAPATANEFLFEVRTYAGAVVYWDDFSLMKESGAIPTLAITSPANGASVPSVNVDVEFVVQNFDVAAGGTGDGYITYEIDNGTTIDKFDTSAISLTGLAAGSHTVDMRLVDNAGNILASPVSASSTFTVLLPTQVADLTALRAGTIGQFYELMNAPTVTYTRANRNQKYIQDSSNSAILIDDSAGAISTVFAIGDGMSGLVGELGEFGGVLQFIPSADASVVAGATITPQLVTITALLADWEPYESELVQINNTIFADGGGTFTASTNYDISDASGGPMTFRPYNEADYVGETIPSGPYALVGIIAEFGGAPQISARSLSDVTLSTDAFKATNFNVYPNPSTNGFVTITSPTSEAISVSVYDVLGKQVLNNTITNNTLNVSSLNSGLYILKISQNGNSITKKLVIK
ncbi:T9SS type A sorting domain-containing protein [Bizionia myxarmorum]|uniref:T9SS type A sorting domain-containing protein n=1 Tax=Bizionia myxarmorum TaxID=291186 RepID=A0A5D0RBY2_9FLAO|nr:T9SS type A sorting domain-containing protein [Bizionia myxarmorum]TYB79022.1 T9SS type A sorting domain-containing protein [Bizionia myxarmorum]